MGSLTSTLLEAFCKGILALTDIAEEETHQLHQLCQFVQRQVTPLFSVKTPNLTVVKVYYFFNYINCFLLFFFFFPLCRPSRLQSTARRIGNVSISSTDF